MTDNTISHFVVLFTAQKQKKFKTWQDGTMKYYSSNKKLVLTDEKGYNIDRKFYKGGIPVVGDEIEFDGHIVTIESIGSTEVVNNVQPVSSNTTVVRPSMPISTSTTTSTPRTTLTMETTPTAVASAQITTAPIISKKQHSSRFISKFNPPTMIPRKRIIKVDPEEEEAEKEETTTTAAIEPMEICETPTHVDSSIPTISKSTTSIPNNGISSLLPTQKRVRVGLSKKTSSALHRSVVHNTNTLLSNQPSMASTSFMAASKVLHVENDAGATSTPITSTAAAFAKNQSSGSSVSKEETDTQISINTVKAFKSPFADGNYTVSTLQFPNSKKAIGLLKAKKYPKRSKVVPTKFNNINLYRETFKKIIYEHLEILLLNYGMYFYSVYEKYGRHKDGQELERTIRSKGMGMYVLCELRGDQRYQSDRRYRILLKGNREHHSRYNKDDIWVISKTPSFESSQTFLARSTYFGPFSDGSLEVDCISPRDYRIYDVGYVGRKSGTITVITLYLE
ncbi:uncharacterized protein BX663DRAFT_31394 [Cokeromyces recurvatus]|uniref:uncharacterized protein n=1 Tax=Cokeromyces recurvatus TaxID=90255 RepID=UPI002220645E|nr:uncharacterized protein BX663DRAFT_31394 [Cokeromyces recurvatus]KAI7903480.1 hypothetical protein BX663DRAFT_31394 [Cokeromyces recurvatus]